MSARKKTFEEKPPTSVALAGREARRRWGPKAFASDRRTEKFVGSGVGDDRFGEGATWEEAFEDADRRIAGASS